MADWPAIVGPALAAVTVPRRFASGTLSIACSGPIALELQHLAGELMARINANLGRVTVTAAPLRAGAGRAAESRTRRRRAHRAPPPRGPPRGSHGLPEGALRDALVALGSAVLTER